MKTIGAQAHQGGERRARNNPKRSDHLLGQALKAAFELGAETRMIKLNDLNLRACEGYYSKTARACEKIRKAPGINRRAGKSSL
jgi:multimeric flavodoxin WrbA